MYHPCVAPLPKKLSLAVRERDSFCCLGCGKNILEERWWSIQHRKARGVGGLDELVNLVTVCGSATSPGCHLLCEARDKEMNARGLWISSWNDPATTPVILWTGISVMLTVDGHYQQLLEWE